jgi:hypothetical protein
MRESPALSEAGPIWDERPADANTIDITPHDALTRAIGPAGAGHRSAPCAAMLASPLEQLGTRNSERPPKGRVRAQNVEATTGIEPV